MRRRKTVSKKKCGLLCNLFFSPHIILEVGKQQDLRNQICQTVGDALTIHENLA
jgi:hypothetical protein